MKTAIIGAGNLGKSIAKGLLKNEQLEQLYLTKRNLEELNEFQHYPEVTLTTNNALAIAQSAIIILAVQPQHLKPVLQNIAEHLGPKHLVISTITGVSIAQLEALCPPKTAIVRAMPNTAIAVNTSMTCLCANLPGNERIQEAASIFEHLGTTLLIPEHQMQAATVVCASGIAFWMRLIRATTQAGIQLGFDAKEAQMLAMHTCQGAANLLIHTGNHPEQEIDKVTTPKGCTIEGLNDMENNGLSAALIQGMLSSFNKINTIKKEQT
ncbi:Pyrroline-5-carboxylate reductase [Tenacibaculum litopenaei]|uniref:pyrroline-5-carboxylate reductase n=1 Tax=Tenacibaculum litopenaei TaxID=396016 RepID=UPI003895D0B3